MCTNIGHADERVTRAMYEQLQMLPYASPFMATEPRARLGAKLASIAPGDIDSFFYQRRSRGKRERGEDCAHVIRPPQDPRALWLLPRWHGRRNESDR